jgi:peptidoglycan/LPS O-acetylase OafA/YrhL
VVLVVWIRELEYLRGFAALAVIAVHISMHFTRIPAVNLPGLLNLFVYITAHFAVPVFIFISGWVLAVRYSGAYSVPAYYQRRARTILPPYLFFTALYLLIPVEGAIRVASLPEPGAVAGALLMGTAAYHLWFFVVIIQLYLLYPPDHQGLRRLRPGRCGTLSPPCPPLLPGPLERGRPCPRGLCRR